MQCLSKIKELQSYNIIFINHNCPNRISIVTRDEIPKRLLEFNLNTKEYREELKEPKMIDIKEPPKSSYELYCYMKQYCGNPTLINRLVLAFNIMFKDRKFSKKKYFLFGLRRIIWYMTWGNDNEFLNTIKEEIKLIENYGESKKDESERYTKSLKQYLKYKKEIKPLVEWLNKLGYRKVEYFHD